MQAKSRSKTSSRDEIDQLMTRIRSDGIKFIRFEIPCATGQAVGMLVPARNCEHFLRNGFPFWSPASMQTINTAMPLNIYEKSGFRNTFAFPDVNSYVKIGWKELVPTASIFVSQASKYDNTYPADCRTIAMRQLNELNDTYNLDILSSIEHEFSILDCVDKNNGTIAGKPISNPGCYHLSRISKYDDFFSKVDSNFQSMGIECDRIHSEVASGQYEITVLPSFNIKGCDDAYWIKNGLREMGSQYKSWMISFMTHLGDIFNDSQQFSIVEDDSGAHFNFSLWYDIYFAKLLYIFVLNYPKPKHSYSSCFCMRKEFLGNF